MDVSRFSILGGGMVAGYAAKELVALGLGPGELTILSADTSIPYERPPLSKAFLAGTDTEAAIIAGKLFPFKCPVIGQDGKAVECKGGDHLDDGQVLGMNFYVKGIDDKIPGK